MSVEPGNAHQRRRPTPEHGPPTRAPFIAAVALTIGSMFTWASRTDTAEGGMNGFLAWTQRAGMPMRPAMGRGVGSTSSVDRGRPETSLHRLVDPGLRLPWPQTPRAALPVRFAGARCPSARPPPRLARRMETAVKSSSDRSTWTMIAMARPVTGAPEWEGPRPARNPDLGSPVHILDSLGAGLKAFRLPRG